MHGSCRLVGLLAAPPCRLTAEVDIENIIKPWKGSSGRRRQGEGHGDVQGVALWRSVAAQVPPPQGSGWTGAATGTLCCCLAGDEPEAGELTQLPLCRHHLAGGDGSGRQAQLLAYGHPHGWGCDAHHELQRWW